MPKARPYIGISTMSFYFDALAGLMEAVHGCALSYFFRNLIILECACHVVVAFEMHGNEVARIDSLEDCSAPSAQQEPRRTSTGKKTTSILGATAAMRSTITVKASAAL